MTQPLPHILPRIRGFDRQGEPQLRHGDNGALELVFNAMPPLTSAGEERKPWLFETFDVVLSNVLGVPVARDDRELFIVSTPNATTAEALAAYLSNFWKTAAKTLAAQLAATPRPADAPFRSAKEFLVAARKQLAKPLAALGFKKRAGQPLDFVRAAPFGEQIVSIYADSFGNPFRHLASVAIVDFRIERPYVRLAAIAPQYVGHLRTHARALKVADFHTSDYSPTMPPPISRPSLLNEWVPLLLNELTTAGFSWFQAMADLTNIHAHYNDIAAPLPEIGDDRTACLGMIVARLAGAANIDEIAAHHRRCLAKLEIPLAYPKVEAFVLAASRSELLAIA